jgi:hypothetical protein
MKMMADVENGGLCSYKVDVLVAVDDDNKYKETDARVVGLLSPPNESPSI